jgi:hypothetical protein
LALSFNWNSITTKTTEGVSLTLEERSPSFINEATQIHSPQADLEIALGLEDLLLRELQERINPISLRELQAQISLTRPVKAITVAASLDRLYRKGRVIRRLVGEGRAHYVYSLMSHTLGTPSRSSPTANAEANTSNRLGVRFPPTKTDFISLLWKSTAIFE